jgi:hypothetical protein
VAAQTDPAKRERAMGGVVSSWSDSDPAAIGNVAEHWLRIDSMAAGEWIVQLPPKKVRDAAAERVVGSTVQSDPATAFEIA